MYTVHHHRKSIRLPFYDYSQEGWYFITICTKNMTKYFGTCGGGKMELNEIGKIIDQCWREIPSHFPHVSLDEYAIMPNHMHGIIVINTIPPHSRGAMNNIARARLSHSTGAINRAPTDGGATEQNNPMGSDSLGEIMRWYKGRCAFEIHKIEPIFLWHRNYYEHIIRNDKELEKIREYIYLNPTNWDLDENNPVNL